MHCGHALIRGVRVCAPLHARPVSTVFRSARTCSTVCVHMQKKKVIVVGAGFAGITAARTLLAEAAAPLDVIVLEASSRVGGRACTTELEGCGKVELGATWLHGLVGNPLYEHAIQLGLMTRLEVEHAKPTWGAMKYVRQGEVSLLGPEDAAVITKARDMYGQAVEASTEAALAGQGGVVGDSVRQAYAQAMQSMDKASSRSKEIFTEAWAWREHLQRAMDGCHTTDDMSANSLAHYDDFEGPNIPIPSGYQVLAQKLAEGLPVRHGVTVDQIHWGPSGVTIQCRGGEQFEADAVIVTVSLGVLKAQHQRMFQPPLPSATVEAIDRLGFGIVDKIYIDFGAASSASPSAAQQDFANYGPAGGSNADQSKTAQHTGQEEDRRADQPAQDDSMHPLTAKDALSYYLLWHCNPESLRPKPSAHGSQEQNKAVSERVNRDPLRDIKDMSSNTNRTQESCGEGSPAAKGAGDKAPETHVITGPQQSQTQGSKGAITASCAEDDAVACTTGRTHDVPVWASGAYTIRFAGSEFVQDESAAGLAAANRCGVVWITGADAQQMEAESDAELYKKIAAILQQFPALALPSDFKVHRSSWGSDPLFRGAYSYGSATARGGECMALANPLSIESAGTGNELRLLFAGEACHPKYFGCTHGAYLTGQSQARVLLTSFISEPAT